MSQSVASSVIEHVLDPASHRLVSLYEDIPYQLEQAQYAQDRKEHIPPVVCRVWKGGREYEEVVFDSHVYPFDTLDHLRYLLYQHYRGQPEFLPRFMFIGVPLMDDDPQSEEQFITYHYLWYDNQSAAPDEAFVLQSPLKALTTPDLRFASPAGTMFRPHYKLRGRSTLERVFLKPRHGTFPIFYVFPLAYLLRAYRGVKPIAEDEWKQKFAPYFPEIADSSHVTPTREDIEYGKSITDWIARRDTSLQQINEIIENEYPVPSISLTGIRRMIMTWKKPMQGFYGSAEFFYRTPVTKQRPFMRLHPADGTPITKLHVQGVVPIPTLEDPRILESWGKEETFTPGYDFCVVKYVQSQPYSGQLQPIYGNLHVMNDGTMNMIVQPPKQIRVLDPVRDFGRFTEQMTTVLDGFPQELSMAEWGDMSVVFGTTLSNTSKRFTAARFRERLPLFQAVFKEISPLTKDSTPVLSLRFKAVNQYSSENQIFSYFTHDETMSQQKGRSQDPIHVLRNVQQEFQLSAKEAEQAFKRWLEHRDTFTVENPEEGYFSESFHPGTDIYIYAQHPSYTFHVYRIDSYETYLRIYTLLSVLMMEDDHYFRMNAPSRYAAQKYDEVEEQVNLAAATAEKKPAPSSLYYGLYNDEEEKGNLPEALRQPAAAATASTAALPARRAEATEIAEQQLVNPKQWFINKLKRLDPGLFGDGSGYSTQCQANVDRQPVVLTQEQYTRMREEYANDGDLYWIIYPLDGDEEPRPMSKDEVITVMRYGSGTSEHDIAPLRYYFCPHYYCLSDEIMVREKDFVSTVRRDGVTPKPANTCPFCLGRLITNTAKAVPGNTVIKRKNRKDGDTPHDQIHFFKVTKHSKGLYLPCCFVGQETLRIDQAEFKHVREQIKEERLRERLQVSALDMEDLLGDLGDVESEENENANVDVDVDSDAENEDSNKNQAASYRNLLYPSGERIHYALLFQKVHSEYILDSLKTPGPGKFAVVPSAFDAFFRQQSGKTMVIRPTIKLMLHPYAQGFLRVGTQNTVYESLLGVIAPLIYKDTITEVKQKIHEAVVPRIFMNSHFGNLVLEFYQPADDSAMPRTRTDLMTWAYTHLGIAINVDNTYALIRLYNAYIRFHRFIDDPQQRKDLRHLQPLLAEPGLFTPNGLQLIVMESNEDQITVKCPAMGISVDRGKRNDFVFLSRTMKKWGIQETPYAHYELFIHTSNRPAKGKQDALHEVIMSWDYASRDGWPAIVRRRVDEFIHQCQSRYQTVYTLQQGEHMMIPLSHAVHASMKMRPEGIVKDSYNHIIAVTYLVKPDSRAVVMMPVIDDGVVSISSAFSVKNIYLTWESVPLASLESTILFYDTQIEPLFSLYKGYGVESIARQNRGDRKVLAIQLFNGLYVPVKPTASDENIQASLAISRKDKVERHTVSIDEFEWDINRAIIGRITKKVDTSQWSVIIRDQPMEQRCGSPSDVLRESTMKELEELYQTFRLMVANWITSAEAGNGLRKRIEEIIFNEDLPPYERRKRMDLLIGSELRQWFDTDPDGWEKASVISFLRKDCRVIDREDACTGSCRWVSAQPQQPGRCLLHVDRTTDLTDDGRVVETAELFVKRVIDELVRFSNLRKQLMKKGEISRISSTIQPMRYEDQYLIPESSMTWSNLLRMEWMKDVPETPRFYEEMSGPPMEENMQEEKKEDDRGSWPLLLRPWFETTSWKWLTPEVIDPERPLLPIAGMLGITLEQLGLEENERSITLSNLKQYVQQTSRPIGWLDFQTPDAPIIQFLVPSIGTSTQIALLVALPSEIGFIVDTSNHPFLPIEQLPATLQTYWSKAISVPMRMASLRGTEEVRVPLVAKRRPPLDKKRTAVQPPLMK